MTIIDTHLHTVYFDRFSYPWLDDEPALKRDWPVEDYWTQAEKLGIEAALHMEVDVAETDMEAEARFAAAMHPKVIGVIAAARPESEDFASYLERLSTLAALKGIRRILHTSPDGLSRSERFAENVRRLASYDLPFDLTVLARQLPVGRELAEKCPDVQFVLDHCGVPDIAGGEMETWRRDIAAIARLPNVAAKISGIVAYAGKDWTVETLRPWFEHVVECFGWDRVVWGSDYPVCTVTADLGRWVAATRQLIAGAGEDEQRKLLNANAGRIYHLDS